jgi:hypothetical protein
MICELDHIFLVDFVLRTRKFCCWIEPHLCVFVRLLLMRVSFSINILSHIIFYDIIFFLRNEIL